MLIRSVETVQLRFTKRLLGMNQLPYTERLTQLGLQSLEQRRLITDLISYYSIIHGHSSLTFSDFFPFTHNPSSRGHSLVFQFHWLKQTSINIFSHVVLLIAGIHSQLLSSQPQVHYHLNDYCSRSTCNPTYHNHGS